MNLPVIDWTDVEADDDTEPYSDEYVAPQATAWTTATSPADIWDAQPLTEWEI